MAVGGENGAGRGVWISESAGRLRCSTDVSMMQTADFGNRDDPAEFRRLNWPSVGCVLVKREVSARLVIVPEVAGQNAAEVAFAQHADMIEALAATEAMRRSATGFCRGLEGAVRTSRIPIPFTRCRNASP